MKKLKIWFLLFLTTLMIVSCSYLEQAGDAFVPTPTPILSGTPAPSFDEMSIQGQSLCNPSWENTDLLNLNIAESSQQANNILLTELRRSTRVVSLTNENIYLTYLSPQVIEAIVINKAFQQDLTAQSRQELLLDIDMRLQLDSTIVFLMMRRESSTWGLLIHLIH